MIRHSSEDDDRSPGDFHSTGASYVPREDSRGTKPARVTPLAVARTRYIKGREALRNKYGYVERSNEMRTASYLKGGHDHCKATTTAYSR